MSAETNFENAMGGIGQAVFEMFGTDTSKEIRNILGCMKGAYVLVQTPDYERYMKEEWFGQEAVEWNNLYFLPIKRVV